MKKQLLLGSALLAAMSAFPQNGRLLNRQTESVNFAERVSSKYARISLAQESTQPASSVQPIGPQLPNSLRTTANSSWQAISGSMNIYGMLVSESKPLQYNNELNAVSFVHRKSSTYISNPVASPSTAASGVIVGMVTQDWGTEWDSTCIWNDNSHWARYPQGGIYNAPSNTNIANAYIVATGPITQVNTSLGWVGNYFASKQLDTVHGAGYTNAASSAPGAMQFIANSAPFGPVGKVDYARLDFTSTDDGMIRALGVIAGNANGTTNSAYGFRGARLVTGTFNSGTFTWTGDSIIPPVRLNPADNSPFVNGTPQMAWNESGTVGYIWFIGCRQNTSGENSGYQPIVYKTVDSGNSWSLLAGIDFTQPTFSTVINSIPGVRNTTLTIPLFNGSEGMDATVDCNDHLHIFATLVGASKSHLDSVGYSYIFNNADQEQYSYSHTPGLRPFLYDFMETSTGWDVAMIDSMPSEAPGTTSTEKGFSDNPWDNTGDNGTKVDVDARLQVSRTPDGKHIIYTWAESDTNFTNSQHKWNMLPNVKARMMTVQQGGSSYTVHPNEINVTNPNSGANTQIQGRATMHYISPKCAVVSGTAAGVAISIPITVSNNQNTPMTQLLSNTHWYESALLNFDNIPSNQITYPQRPGINLNLVGIAENSLNSANSTVLFPNPAHNAATLRMDLADNSKIEVVVMNAIGQVVKTSKVNGAAGNNDVNLDLSGLSKGVYMVNVKVNGASSTRKLIVD